MKRLVYLAILFLACQPNKEKPTYEKPDHHVKEITKVFDAHGGFERWTSMKSLSYELDGEQQLISLEDRKVLVKNEQRTIGFDGNEVWVMPDSVNASRARFYHNLYFYFYAMPFVLGDPGINYQVVEPKEMQGEVLNGIKVSYGDAVGDSPDDNYILWYDPASYQMKWLMYTVTYGKDESSDRYNLIKYPEWTDANGLRLPKKLQWHVYQNDSIGAIRGESVFTNIQINEQQPNANLFELPEGALIAPGPDVE